VEAMPPLGGRIYDPMARDAPTCGVCAYIMAESAPTKRRAVGTLTGASEKAIDRRDAETSLLNF